MGDIERGERILAGTRAGHEAVHGTPEEKAARYAAYQVAVDEKHGERPAIKSWKHLSNLEASDVGCSGCGTRYTFTSYKDRCSVCCPDQKREDDESDDYEEADWEYDGDD